MRLSIGAVSLNLCLALYFTLVLNLPILNHFYRILTGLPHYDVGFALTIPLVLLAALNLVFLPFSWRPLQKGFFFVLLLLSSVVSYAMLNYGVVFDYSMVQNIVETNTGEAAAYLNASVIGWVILTGLLPALLLLTIKVRPSTKRWHGLARRLGSGLASVLLIALVAAGYYKDYASVGRNNSHLNREIVPSSYLYSGYRYVQDTYFSQPQPFIQIGTDAKQKASPSGKPSLMILVVGETARAQNYALNGYPRPTNPYTRDLGVISFQQVRSCGTATAVSVPCMFSNMTRSNYSGKQAKHQEGLLDVLQHAGLTLAWRDNDGGCKGVCDRIPHEQIPKDDPKLCNGESCHDEVLLKGLADSLAEPKGNTLVTLHLMGSHGPTYFQRYPDSARYFTPDCPRSDIENCSQEALLNTYDNSLRYTDQVLAQLIQTLQGLSDRYDTALLYLSDHGESLGEKGLYLHGTPYAMAPSEQTHVPMIGWFSPAFAQDKSLDLGCLRQEAQQGQYSQDNLFHSVLGLMDVTTQEYQPQLDLFRPCRLG